MRDLIKAKSKLELPEGMLSSVIDAMADLHPQLPIFFSSVSFISTRVRLLRS
ncbi:hypothetical protein Vca1114GL_00096 [Vibrio campbellii]|nr:hypothetical protein Vca1114GL_00096 [Vibrio campbellii]